MGLITAFQSASVNLCERLRRRRRRSACCERSEPEMSIAATAAIPHISGHCVCRYECRRCKVVSIWLVDSGNCFGLAAQVAAEAREGNGQCITWIGVQAAEDRSGAVT